MPPREAVEEALEAQAVEGAMEPLGKKAIEALFCDQLSLAQRSFTSELFRQLNRFSLHG